MDRTPDDAVSAALLARCGQAIERGRSASAQLAALFADREQVVQALLAVKPGNLDMLAQLVVTGIQTSGPTRGRDHHRALESCVDLGWLVHAPSADGYRTFWALEPQASVLVREIWGLTTWADIATGVADEPVGRALAEAVTVDPRRAVRDAVIGAAVAVQYAVSVNVDGTLNLTKLRRAVKATGVAQDRIEQIIIDGARWGVASQNPSTGALRRVDDVVDRWVADQALHPTLSPLYALLRGFWTPLTLIDRALVVMPEFNLLSDALGEPVAPWLVVKRVNGTAWATAPEIDTSETADGAVLADFSVILGEAADVRIVEAVALFGELKSLDRMATFRLTPASLARGGALGGSLDRLRWALARIGSHGVPQTVATLVDDAARRVARAESAIVLRIDPQHAAAFRSQLPSDDVAELGPGAFVLMSAAAHARAEAAVKVLGLSWIGASEVAAEASPGRQRGWDDPPPELSPECRAEFAELVTSIPDWRLVTKLAAARRSGRPLELGDEREVGLGATLDLVQALDAVIADAVWLVGGLRASAPVRRHVQTLQTAFAQARPELARWWRGLNPAQRDDLWLVCAYLTPLLPLLALRLDALRAALKSVVSSDTLHTVTSEVGRKAAQQGGVGRLLLETATPGVRSLVEGCAVYRTLERSPKMMPNALTPHETAGATSAATGVTGGRSLGGLVVMWLGNLEPQYPITGIAEYARSSAGTAMVRLTVGPGRAVEFGASQVCALLAIQ